MSRKPLDLTGKKFGYLTVLEQNRKDKHGHLMWQCRCDYQGCGNLTTVLSSNLVNGLTTRCPVHHNKENNPNSHQKELIESNGGITPWAKTRKKNSNNSSGVKGVSKIHIKARNVTYYQAHFTVNGEVYKGRRHRTIEPAADEYKQLVAEHLDTKNKPPAEQ